MKLIIAIINNDDSPAVAAHLSREYYTVTEISTTGGYMMSGNTTLLVGTDESRVERAKEIIREHSVTRTKKVETRESFGRGLSAGDTAAEITVSGATVFVLDVSDMEKY